ncbi:MAG: hypothetical protein NTW52_02425 [Planctomycetota bacterium]|nr:hypothetical protein [Planctomycetota bacterium]
MEKLSFQRGISFGLVTVVGISSGCVNWSQIKQECHTDRMRNSAWPQPFRSADAAAAVAPFEVMKANGWQEFNTLAHCYFNESNQLTDAGNLKLQEVLSLTAQSKAPIYVQRGESEQSTAARVESMELAISALIPEGPLPQIAITDTAPATSSGAYQTVVSRALIQTTPNPRLPKFGAINAPSQNTVAPSAAAAESK